MSETAYIEAHKRKYMDNHILDTQLDTEPVNLEI